MKFQLVGAVLALLMSIAEPSHAGVLHEPRHQHLHRHHHHVHRDTSRYVFAHIIVGTLANRNGPDDWDLDMKRAAEVGIDAFALNIGTDSYTDQQLQYAYDSAAKNGMKCFISFDFNWWSPGAAQTVGRMAAQYGSHSAQLQVDGKIFVSTFVGDGLDVSAFRAAVGKDIYFAPNFNPTHGTNLASTDCAFNWMGWPNNGNNRAPDVGQTGTVDAAEQVYLNALGGKDYMAPVSPWFFTHYGREVSYSKNWVFPGDTLWFDRWTKLLKLAPRFIEIVSWNDYGESHYVGPLGSPHTDDGASKWINDMPHDGWLDMAKPFISAYKAGSSSVNQFIDNDQLIYWYRPQPKTVNCDATDTCMAPPEGGDYYLGRPNGWDTMSDSVFVVSLLKAAGTLEVSSGGSKQSFQVPAGASIQTVPMGIGKQSFSLSRDGSVILTGTSAKDIIDGCVCGVYNFNAYVGTLPSRSVTGLTSSGLSNFAKGLKVSTCAATPSLSISAPATTQSSNSTTTVLSNSTMTVPSTTIPANTTATMILTTSANSLATSLTGSTTPYSSNTTVTVTSALVPSSNSSSTVPIISTIQSSKSTSTQTLTQTLSQTLSQTLTQTSSSSAKLSSISSTTPSSTPSSKSSLVSTSTQISTQSTKQSSTLSSSSKLSSVSSSSTSSASSSKLSSASSSSSSTQSSTSKSTTVSTSSNAPQSSPTCNGGVGPGNYAGLCSFSCSYGYCPPGPCTCTSYGTPAQEPARTGKYCVPADGLDQSYSGLCAFVCDRGYYPQGACKIV